MAQVDFREHERLLKSVASRVLRRLHAAGARSTQFEDVFQELVIAWCQARDSWSAEHGVPFGPYMMRGAYNHINRYVDRLCRQVERGALELDADVDSPFGQGGQGQSPYEAVADVNAEAPDETVVLNDLKKKVLDRLSKRSRQFLELLDSPPPVLMEILEGLRARADYARQRGVVAPTAVPSKVSAAIVFDLMGADRTERHAIYKEINRVAKRVSQ